MRLEKESRRWRGAIRLVGLIGILILPLVTCKSPTSPNGQGEADIIVSNEYGETLDIYMDGSFKFSLRHKNSIEIDNVSLGEHELEAKIVGEETVVDSETISVEDKTKYTWTIEDPPDINVTNNFGTSLKIYMDGNYQFDLVDKENRWIIDVPYGERFLKAMRTSDEKEAASTTIKVDDNADYSWTIVKISVVF
ncbi:MAG: hypothetical protein QHH14_00870 [Clostridiales bacterium]|nr:hypothetical protein [Clostridiales bacterium]